MSYHAVDRPVPNHPLGSCVSGLSNCLAIPSPIQMRRRLRQDLHLTAVLENASLTKGPSEENRMTTGTETICTDCCPQDGQPGDHRNAGRPDLSPAIWRGRRLDHGRILGRQGLRRLYLRARFDTGNTRSAPRICHPPGLWAPTPREMPDPAPISSDTMMITRTADKQQ